LVDKSSVLSRLGLSASKYFVVSLHREENVDSETNLSVLVATLNSVADHFKMPLIMSLHPRTKKRLETAKLALDSRVLVLPPFGLPDYVRLQRDSYCTLSDSGTITEESSLLGFPAVTLREAHERPEGVDEGVLVMTGVSAPNVITSIELTRKQFETFGPAAIPQDYLSHNLSWKVLKIILSYTEYVNRRVWFK
jgi:UDP-N-acetylglucosamine 2-epimerase (non-hydrolysing)